MTEEGKLNPPEEPGLNLEGLDSSSDEEDDQKVDKADVEIEIPQEERHKVLMRKVDTLTKTFGAAAAGKGAIAQTVTIKKLLSLATPRERCQLYLGWIASCLTGAVLPSFIFMLGPVFDSFEPG